jgi:phosphatidylserine/phosphatidylglycerophosphate/cardiolipin synthase-like enzyme
VSQAATAARSSTPAVARAAIGRPRVNYVPTSRPYFSYPNRGKAARLAIRNRVLRTIQSTWGGPKTRGGLARSGNGRIRIATWSFKDWTIARALVAARNRGASVQVVAAKATNKGSGPWRYLRKRLGKRLYKPGHPNTRELVSFARQCSGACRGPGGTAHAKYFLFDRVGTRRARAITFNTSMNLTRTGYRRQWNQAHVMKSPRIYGDFVRVFRQARIGRPVSRPYRARRIGNVVDYFFPRPRSRAAQDPVMQILRRVACSRAGSGANRNGRTRIRIIQYAMYGDRGVWIAKKLRNLWSRGCDIKIIYGVTSRPVLQVLRNRSGRGAVPMRQSATKNGRGELTRYNHSKWMTVTGRWAPSRSNWITFTGSANWSLAAFGSDEQMQRVHSRRQTLPYLRAFNATWGQKTSKRPPGGRVVAAGRTAPVAGVPEDAPTWGQGAYRYMAP